MSSSAGERPGALKVMHIIGGLPKGGAEEMLFRLVKENTRNHHLVVSLQGLGDYGSELQELEIHVETMNMKKGLSAFMVLPALVRLIRNFKPDVIQTWMYYSDFLGGVCGYLAGMRNVVWGIHHSTMDNTGSSLSSRVFMRLCTVASYVLPRATISCSEMGARVHMDAGYSKKKMIVVHNGYDLSQFFAIPDNRDSSLPADDMSELVLKGEGGSDAHANHDSSVASLRDVYSISNDVFVLGMIARYDPQKDHQNLIAALSTLQESGVTDWVCLLFGTGMDKTNLDIVSLISKADLTENVILHGLSRNIAAHVRQLDLVVLSSRYGEAFPNVLNEAMASEVPCVTTDVGDSSTIVGNLGWVVPPSNPAQLAQAVREAMKEFADEPLSWEKRRKACRDHISDNFSIAHMADGYERIWRSGMMSK